MSGSARFAQNPLSLSVPERELRAWAEESDEVQIPQSRAARGRRGSVASRSLSLLTVEDLMQPPKLWKEFFSLERMQQAYGLPSTYADVSSRITENIYTYMGNYLRMSLVCVLCVLYKRPSALVGVVLTAKAWDWLRINSAGVDQQSYNYKIKYTAIYIFTWAVIVFSSVTGAMLLAALISTLVVCVHGTFRIPSSRSNVRRR